MAKTEQFTETEIRNMIKEEYSKKLKQEGLKIQLKAINEEISKLEGCGMEEENIEEVKTGGETSVRSTAWTGEKGGDKKFKPEFEKKMAGGRVAALKEGGEEEIEITGEPEGEKIEIDEEPKEGEIDDATIEKVIAGLKDILEAPETQEAIKDAIEGKTEEKPEEIMAGAGEEVPEEEKTEEQIDEKVIKEQDGISVAQAVEAKDAVPFDNGKEAIPATKLNEELSRWQILSGIKKNPLYS